MSAIAKVSKEAEQLLFDPYLAEERAHIILNMPLNIASDPIKRISYLAKKLISLQKVLNKVEVLS